MEMTLLLLRATVGLLLAGHGAQKLLGWFGGGGLTRTAEWLQTLGFRPARTWAAVAGGFELAGGLLFALGLLSPLGSILIGGVMLMAATKVHWPRVWIAEGGFELPLVNLAVVLAVAVSGPGALSLDTLLDLALPWPVAIVVIAAVLAGWLAGLVLSIPDPATVGKVEWP